MDLPVIAWDWRWLAKRRGEVLAEEKEAHTWVQAGPVLVGGEGPFWEGKGRFCALNESKGM